MNKRAMAAERGAKAAERQGLPAPSALIERDAGKTIIVKPAGLRLITTMAARGEPQSLIASRLGMTARQFKTLLGSSDDANAVRLAWEKGHAEHEAYITRLLLKHAQTNAIAGIYYSKARLNWTDTAQPAAGVQSNVQIVLPRPMTSTEYFSMLGISQPLDYSKPLPKPREGDAPALPAPPPSPNAPWPILLGQTRSDESTQPQPQTVER